MSNNTLRNIDKIFVRNPGYARSHKVERRLNLRTQIILGWKDGLT